VKVCREVVDYFKNRFKEAGWSRPTLDGLSFPTLTLEQSINLTKVCLEEKISEVVALS
jgi:hypothetical protein